MKPKKSLKKLLKKRLFNDPPRNKIILFIFLILLAVPLLRALFVGDFQYSFNISFYTQKIYLITALFVFLSYLLLQDKIKFKKPDLDNTIVYGIIAFGLFIWLASLHVNFDTLMKTDLLDLKDNTVQIGSGSILADTIDLDRIEINPQGIKKIIELNNISNKTIVKLHGWKEKNSTVYLLVNDHKFDASKKFSNQPGWVSLPLPGRVFKKGKNILKFKVRNSPAYLSSQWVYHDGKTLTPQNKYHGQEAFVYADQPANISWLFQFGFKYKLILRLLALVFLLSALFKLPSIKLVRLKFKYHFLALAITSTLAVNALFFIQNQWKYLSLMVAQALYFILNFFSNQVYTNFSDPLGPVIGLGDFIIRIYKNCSGIESLAIFLILFLILVCFNWPRINKFSLPFLLGLGLGGVFLINIIRLIFLILIGLFVSKDMAAQFFHTNLGWLLVLGYFMVFNYWVKRFFVKTDSN